MNNNINNTSAKVPNTRIHSGCSLAATGRFNYDYFDEPLAPFAIIPEETDIQFIKEERAGRGLDGPFVDVKYRLPDGMENPSSVREEPLVTVAVPVGVHPFTFLKEKGVDIENSWIFMNNDVANVLRKMPCRFHQVTIAYGEFFRFEDFDTISLQTVEYFPDWKVIMDGKIGEKEFNRTDKPVSIIEVVMEK